MRVQFCMDRTSRRHQIAHHCKLDCTPKYTLGGTTNQSCRRGCPVHRLQKIQVAIALLNSTNRGHNGTGGLQVFSRAKLPVPLVTWLPEMKAKNKARFSQVRNLINALLPSESEFTGRMMARDFVFSIRGQDLPFQALSDGYRAYI